MEEGEGEGGPFRASRGGDVEVKYHSWYLCQISLQIALLPIQIELID